MFHGRQGSLAVPRSALVLLLVAIVVPVSALLKSSRTAAPAVGFRFSGQRRKANPVTFVALVPRGGAENDRAAASRGGVGEAEAEADEEIEEKETEPAGAEAVEEAEEEPTEDDTVEETIEAEAVGESEEEEAAVVEEEVAEELLEEEDEEEEPTEAEEGAVEEEDEDDEVVVFPTEEIPSDDVRAFHTTDGELADDEGMYTDGNNESPIADNDAAAAAAMEAGDGGDGGDAPESEDAVVAEAPEEIGTAVAAAAVTTIDAGTKRALVADLRYTEDDVANMRPEIAGEVVHHKLARPTEGMPKNWYKNAEDVPKPSLLSGANTKTVVVSVAAVGVAALSIGALTDNDGVGDAIEDLVDALKGIPQSLAAMVVAAKTASVSKGPTPQAAAAPVASKTTQESSEEEDGEDVESSSEAVEDMDNGIHSIKPGTSPSEVPDPEVDDTWLDKMLTWVEKGFKSFFNMKI
mmetsp:Transcript_984/g.2165  ORF Transcript_984/g.2165 Transcript_984/m.2165 type:complete len:464 (+) Transcript_984:2-1393(+)